jgi:hypothetical protein
MNPEARFDRYQPTAFEMDDPLRRGTGGLSMRKSARTQAIAERNDFALRMIAAGVVIGAFIALAI